MRQNQLPNAIGRYEKFWGNIPIAFSAQEVLDLLTKNDWDKAPLISTVYQHVSLQQISPQ